MMMEKKSAVGVVGGGMAPKQNQGTSFCDADLIIESGGPVICSVSPHRKDHVGSVANGTGAGGTRRFDLIIESGGPVACLVSARGKAKAGTLKNTIQAGGIEVDLT